MTALVRYENMLLDKMKTRISVLEEAEQAYEKGDHEKLTDCYFYANELTDEIAMIKNRISLLKIEF